MLAWMGNRALDVVFFIALKGTPFHYEWMFDYDWLVFVQIAHRFLRVGAVRERTERFKRHRWGFGGNTDFALLDVAGKFFRKKRVAIRQSENFGKNKKGHLRRYPKIFQKTKKRYYLIILYIPHRTLII